MIVSDDKQGDAPPSASAKAFDLFNIPDSYYQNPHPFLKALRDDDPIHQNSDGSVLITRYEDIKRVWRDLSCVVNKEDFFAEKFGPGPLLEHHTTTMLFRDPPDHDRLRALVNPFFSPSSVNALNVAVERRVGQLLTDAAERQEIDFVGDFAFQLTISMICHILGIPNEDAYIVQELGKRILMPLNPDVGAEVIASGHGAADEFKRYLLEHVNRCRKRSEINSGDDIISALVAAERSGSDISEEEMLHMCIVILNGGHESTTNLLSCTMKALIEQPQAMAQMRSDDVALNTAIEECVRFVTPLQLQGRRTTKPMALTAGELPADTEVIISVGSANWDESIFQDPEMLNLARKPNAHVGFGAGVHVCIGRFLAKLEASVALPKFVRMFETIEITGPSVYRPSARFRGVAALPLKLN